jgi:hydrogenase large subunit
VDPNSPNVINWERINFIGERIKQMRDFVEQVYVPDVKAVASFYPDWWNLGAGHMNYLSYGGLQDGDRTDQSKFGFNRGVIVGGDLSNLGTLDQTKITEAIAHSYYDYAGGDQAALHPWEGETKPHYSGPTPPYTQLGVDNKYSWLKSPRYDGKPMEVGPLARMLVGYASGNARIKTIVNSALTELKLQPAQLFSTLGRVAARALETVYLLDMMDGWLAELTQNMETGDLRIHEGSKWDPETWPAEAEGWGFHEAPRGALGHWIKIKDKKIVNYQAVVPSTWNAGPRDAQGQTGPYEASLEGTPVADPERPLELLRTIHSFDPCLACAVHVVDATGKERVRVEVR